MPNMCAATITKPASSWCANFANVVMTRTFSKIHGLAGLRIGWAYRPARVADVLNRIRGPFNVSTPAQHAAAAALTRPRPCRARRSRTTRNGAPG